MRGEPNQDTVLDLIRLIYEAAGDPHLWPSFLEKLAAAVRATCVALVVHDLNNGKAQVGADFGLDPAFNSSYTRHYSAINPWVVGNEDLRTPGRVLESSEVFPDRELVRTEFYNDFLKPQGLFFSLGGIVTRENSSSSYVTSLRPHSAGVYEEPESSLLRVLMPHLQCAMRLHQRISALETNLSALTDSIHLLPGGVVIVNSQARILVMNRSAETILAARNGLREGPAGLLASKATESKALQAAIATAVAARDGAINAPVLIAISRDAFQRPLQVLIAPLPPQTAGSHRQSAAVLFITDPDDQCEPNFGLLRQLFGFTHTESRVAAALMQGKSVTEIASEFRVTLNTIRAHMKQVFAKTDTRRQGELIRLLLTSSPAKFPKP